ncbi:MAG: ribosome silencing factor [Terriglobales bacterium]
MAKKTDLRRQVSGAIAACEEKKAEDVSVLELDKASGGFTDYFVICSGSNPKQIQAISDEVEQRLSREGLRPTHVEGYKQAEWVLLDYVDFVVHVFSHKARHFYNLERLWKSAKPLAPAELRTAARKRARAKATPTSSRARPTRRRARRS